MGMRLVMQLADSGKPLPARIIDLLRKIGATDMRAPHPELPGLYVANLPDTANVADLLDQLKAETEVRDAEIEQFRTGL